MDKTQSIGTAAKLGSSHIRNNVISLEVIQMFAISQGRGCKERSLQVWMALVWKVSGGNPVSRLQDLSLAETVVVYSPMCF